MNQHNTVDALPTISSDLAAATFMNEEQFVEFFKNFGVRATDIIRSHRQAMKQCAAEVGDARLTALAEVADFTASGNIFRIEQALQNAAKEIIEEAETAFKIIDQKLESDKRFYTYLHTPAYRYQA